MANEITVPLLPCRSIDEIVEFYGMLGFSQTYYQVLASLQDMDDPEDLA